MNKIVLHNLRSQVQLIVGDAQLPAVQYAVARDGELLAFEALGAATPDNRFCIFSASKPIFASLIWQMIGAGELALETRVSEIWPEFSQHGKDGITLEHLLLLTAGIPQPLPREHLATMEQRAGWDLAWEPGTRFEYHPTSAHWVLAEIVRRTTGQDHREVLRTRILDPLGLARLQLGVPSTQQGDMLRVERIGRNRPDIAEAVFGAPVPTEHLDAEAEWTIALANDADVVAAGVPGGGVVSDAASVALFYQALLHNEHGVWDPDILRIATSEIRNNIADPARLGATANRTIGLVKGCPNAPRWRAPELGIDLALSEFGPAVPATAFGHNGFGGQTAWADPASGISFCFLTNGADRDSLAEFARQHLLNAAAIAAAA